MKTKFVFLSSFILLTTYPHTQSIPSEESGKIRSRRALSESEKELAVAEHNKYRRWVIPKASNMREMIWDEDIAKIAEAHANKCVYEHNSRANRKTDKFSTVGENLYISSVEDPVRQALARGIQDWDDERSFYTYSSSYCSGVCGHYTQNVWAASYALGCAVVTCKNMNVFGSVWQTAQYVVCNYGPGGNYVGVKPYKQGTPCSQCPQGTICNFGLCCDSSLGCGPDSPQSERSAAHRLLFSKISFTITLWLFLQFGI